MLSDTRDPRVDQKPGDNLRRLMRALRLKDFTRDFDTRAGGVRTVQFSKQFGIRRNVIVQLWGDGRHRATHDFKGCSDTPPTDFTTLLEMAAAIEHEAARTDGKYCLPGSLPTEQMEAKEAQSHAVE